MGTRGVTSPGDRGSMHGGDKDESAGREEKESQAEGTKFLPVLSSSVASDG